MASIFLHAGTTHGATTGQHCDYANIKIRETEEVIASVAVAPSIVSPQMLYFEDYDVNQDGIIDVHDLTLLVNQGNTDMASRIPHFVTGEWPMPPHKPTGMRRGGRIRSVPGGRGKKMARGGRAPVRRFQQGGKLQRGGRTRPVPRRRIRKR